MRQIETTVALFHGEVVPFRRTVDGKLFYKRIVACRQYSSTCRKHQQTQQRALLQFSLPCKDSAKSVATVTQWQGPEPES